MNTTQHTSRRNLIMILAFIFLSLAYFSGPKNPALLITPNRLVVLALIITGSLFGALGIRELSTVFLSGPNRPWYNQRGARLLITISLAAILSIVFAVLNQFPRESQILYALSRLQLFLLAIAFTLLWIVILDWQGDPRIEKPQFKHDYPTLIGSEPQTPKSSSTAENTKKPAKLKIHK